MDKKELIIFGLIALIAVILIYHFAWPQQRMIIVEKPAAIPETAAPEIPAQLPQEAPVIETPAETPAQPIPESAPEAAPSEKPKEEGGLVFGEEQGPFAEVQKQVPTKANLIPYYVEFQVNKLIIPAYFGYPFIPIKEDRIRTFSGKFGPYYYDYRQYFDVELCSSLLNSPEMVVCEKIYDLNYIDNYITFTRGYPPDEYIANTAMREFTAFFVIKDKNKELIAKSNGAPIKLVKD
ncbi:MAG: hypothetical protein QW666_00625 [Candidatus Woesearchaeota archaeon]